MRISPDLSAPALLAEIGRRIERTRLERDLTQDQLATAASVGVATLRRLEDGRGATLTNFLRVLRALDLLAGLEATLPEPVPSPIQQLRLRGRQRRRASGRHRGAGPAPPAGEPEAWRWGDEEAP
jgi:transcriptional regulator with XRE-family HTH domain